MFLTVVMMTQNIQVTIAGTTTEELDARTSGKTVTQSQPSQDQLYERTSSGQYQKEESQENGENATDFLSDGIYETENDTEDTTAAAPAENVSAAVTQQIFQQEYSGIVYNFVQMTAEVTNNDAENDASGVNIKVLLPASQLSYVNGVGSETSGIEPYAAADAAYAGYLSDIPQEVLNTYDGGQAIMWCSQTISAGQTAAYTFTVQLQDGITDVSDVNTAWYVNGNACSVVWKNTEVLTPTPEPTEELEPTEDPEPTEEPVPTEAPEPTEEPAPTEAPTAEPTPEITVTPTPEATPTPEVNEDSASSAQNSVQQKEIRRLLQQRNLATLSLDDDVSVMPAGEGESDIGFDESISPNDYDDLKTFLTSVNMKIIDEDGNEVTDYDPENISASGKKFNLVLSFGEEKSNMEKPYLKYKLPDALNISKDIAVQSLAWAKNTPQDTIKKYGVPGYYKVDAAANTLYIQMNESFITNHDVSANVELWGEFHRTSESEETITIGNTTFTLKFDSNPIEATKGVSSTYDKDNGFTFTIDVISYGTPNDVIITDTLGSNLELIPGSVKAIVGGNTISITSNDESGSPYVTAVDSSNTFTVGLEDEWLDAPENGSKKITIQYQAKIKDMRPNDNGTVPGLGNTAIVQEKDKTDYRKVTANGSYLVDWIRKPAGELQSDGTIKWTLIVNEGGKANVNGLTVTDTLKGKGLQYDTSKPIVISEKDGSTAVTVDWTNPGLTHGYNSSGEEYWEYTISEEGFKEYTFTYYTLVQPGLGETAYGNMGTVSKGDDSTSTGIIYGDGTGTGTGEGIISKRYNRKVTVDGNNYAEWTAVIHVPASGLTKVVFTDQLSGNHKFPEGVTQGKNIPNIKCDLQNVNLTITYTDYALTILFGNAVDNSSLPKMSSDYDVTITYYTELTAAEGTIENTARVQSEQKSGFVNATEELKEYSFGKKGSISADNPKVLDWTIILSKNIGIDLDKSLVQHCINF